MEQRLGTAIFINQPFIFSVFWGAIKKILHEKTCRKVIFLDKKREVQLKQLSEVFDLDDPRQLEQEFGGGNPHKFSLPVWLETEMRFFAELRAEQHAGMEGASRQDVGPAGGGENLARSLSSV